MKSQLVQAALGIAEKEWENIVKNGFIIGNQQLYCLFKSECLSSE
jgi:hypothetical protein